MRTRIVAPVLVALAAVVGLVLGLRSPSTVAVKASSTPTPSASAPGSPSESPQSSDSPTTDPTSDPTDSTTGTPPSAQPTFAVTKLRPGQKAPQFVVVSFDGACKKDLWDHYLSLGAETNSRFTFFLSGLCLVPDAQASLYKPPLKPAGTSAIGFADASLVPARIDLLGKAYLAGHEIGTHFLGHFCDSKGVGAWSTADWNSEITQFNRFLDDWQTINSLPDVAPLPFNSSVIRGGRTPCLDGKRDQMFPAFKAAGYTYDASNSGALVWPGRLAKYGMWEFPLQTIKIVGYGKSALSMDYNFLFQQNGGKITADPATCARIEKSAYESFMAALASVHDGNRAPLFVGNHFNTWVCGAYKNALTKFVRDAHTKYPDVQFISNHDLETWLEAQDPKVLAALQARGPVSG